MSWRDLLQTDNETLVSPWVGGRSLRSEARTWSIEGDPPREHGWYIFNLNGRKARFGGSRVEPDISVLRHCLVGYLVGDRLILDGIEGDPDPTKFPTFSLRVHLVEDGLDRFARIRAGCMYEGGPLVYCNQEMPLGPEEDALRAYLDRSPSIKDFRGVPPALDAAFRIESWRREETDRRRLELERLRREEEERRLLEERRQEIVRQLGDGIGRRRMAQFDFAEAARSALSVGGAEFLDHRRAYHTGEMVVRFRLLGRRFECTCDERTLRIIDSGICLTNEATGEKGDTRFTLESFPSVIMEADREGKLVVYRHVD